MKVYAIEYGCYDTEYESLTAIRSSLGKAIDDATTRADQMVKDCYDDDGSATVTFDSDKTVVSVFVDGEELDWWRITEYDVN